MSRSSLEFDTHSPNGAELRLAGRVAGKASVRLEGTTSWGELPSLATLYHSQGPGEQHPVSAVLRRSSAVVEGCGRSPPCCCKRPAVWTQEESRPESPGTENVVLLPVVEPALDALGGALSPLPASRPSLGPSASRGCTPGAGGSPRAEGVRRGDDVWLESVALSGNVGLWR